MRFKLFAVGECRRPVYMGSYATLDAAVFDVAAVDKGAGPFSATWPEGFDGAIVDVETGDHFYVDEEGAINLNGMTDPDLVELFAR